MNNLLTLPPVPILRPTNSFGLGDPMRKNPFRPFAGIFSPSVLPPFFSAARGMSSPEKSVARAPPAPRRRLERHTLPPSAPQVPFRCSAADASRLPRLSLRDSARLDLTGLFSAILLFPPRSPYAGHLPPPLMPAILGLPRGSFLQSRKLRKDPPVECSPYSEAQNHFIALSYHGLGICPCDRTFHHPSLRRVSRGWFPSISPRFCLLRFFFENLRTVLFFFFYPPGLASRVSIAFPEMLPGGFGEIRHRR